MIKNKIPNPKDHLIFFELLLKKRIPFTFIRFSDGEIEILRNRFLEINKDYVFFRDKKLKNKYPAFDQKKFDPIINSDFRRDLLHTSLHSGNKYYKGIPTKHNKTLEDKEFMIRMNGGSFENLTFSDLLINSNFITFLKKIVPLFKDYNIYIIANHRAKFTGCIRNAKHIKIPDNFFNDYHNTKNYLINDLKKITKNSLILSSASSMSNVIGFELHQIRKDLTFIDIGTSLNSFLGLDYQTRNYHNQLKDNSIYGYIKYICYKLSTNYRIKW